MNKNKVIFALVGFVLSAVAAIPAQADPPQEGDGHGGFGDPIRVSDAVDEEEARDIDQAGNHDQWICEKNNGGGLHYRDNNE